MSEVDNTTEISNSTATKNVLNHCEHCSYFKFIFIKIF